MEVVSRAHGDNHKVTAFFIWLWNLSNETREPEPDDFEEDEEDEEDDEDEEEV